MTIRIYHRSPDLAIMNQNVRNLFFIISLILSVLFMPALLWTSVIELPEEDLLDSEEDDFASSASLSAYWIRIPVHQMSVLLSWGISIFALFAVYLGGRSKHRRFNDRTLDRVIALISYSLKTALLSGAVFVFPGFPCPFPRPNQQILKRFIPTLIPNLRRSVRCVQLLVQV